MLKLLILILLLFLPVLSCQKNRANLDLMNEESKIVYIEANSDKGIGSDSFGEIVIMGLSTNNKYFATNNTIYEKSSIWGPDGNIIFLTNYTDDTEGSNFKGISGPYNIVLYDLQTNIQKGIEIPFQQDKPKYLRSTISDINWLDIREWIIFRTSDNTVYNYSMKEGSVNIIKEFDLKQYADFHMILNLKCSSDEKFLAFNYLNTEVIGKAGLGVYDINNKTVKIISIPHITKFFDWSIDNNRVIFYESKMIKEYGLTNDSINIIFEPTFPIEINECQMLNDSSFVLLAHLESNSNEVAVFNRNTNKITWLTNTKLDKQYLDISRGAYFKPAH